MSETPELDKVSFPGGYDLSEIVAAVKLSAMRHVEEVPLGDLDRAIVERFLKELAARHPDSVPFADPYTVRAQELFDERRSLLHGHLRFSWFALAYWTYGLVAARSRLSTAEYDDLGIFLTPVVGALRELGVLVREEECLDEVDRFLPLKVSARSVEASTHAFLSFVRFLHQAALRRRQLVRPGLTLPSVGLAFAEEDGLQAGLISTFLTSHGVSLLRQPEEVTQTARLLVLLSRQAIGSDAFWRGLEGWKSRPVIPMVVCLMAKAELYREPPFERWKELWSWLGHNVAVELGSETDRYVVLLRAIDSPDPKRWWWNRGDAIELGLAVDVLGQGIPRPPARRQAAGPTGEHYPFAVHGLMLSACLLASERLGPEGAKGRDAKYLAICDDLLRLRLKPNGEPYSLPWYVLIYRAWQAFAAPLSGHGASREEAAQAERELQSALFALGIGTGPSEVPEFLEAFARLPWPGPPDSIAAVDERTMAFLVLVHHLSQAALARGQRMRLQHPASPCFISYARPDEDLARELVAHLEAKGADVWWDLHAITLGTPLDESLRSAVADARHLFLVATRAADQSSYVRLEIETAIRQGLRIVPIAPDGRLPAGLESLMASAPSSFESTISAPDSDRAIGFPLALARLQRTSAEQLGWLQSQAPYENLCAHLAQARMQIGGTGSV